MLIKHIFSYFISRGLTGIINFVAIALYTRMLTTADYGEYALIVATAGFINAILFQWIRLVLLRFLSKYKKKKRTLPTRYFIYKLYSNINCAHFNYVLGCVFEFNNLLFRNIYVVTYYLAIYI